MKSLTISKGQSEAVKRRSIAFPETRETQPVPWGNCIWTVWRYRSGNQKLNQSHEGIVYEKFDDIEGTIRSRNTKLLPSQSREGIVCEKYLAILKGQSEAVTRSRMYNIMIKINKTRRQTMIYKTLHRKLNTEEHDPHKTGGELGWSERVSSSCSFNISMDVFA